MTSPRLAERVPTHSELTPARRPYPDSSEHVC